MTPIGNTSTKHGCFLNELLQKLRLFLEPVSELVPITSFNDFHSAVVAVMAEIYSFRDSLFVFEKKKEKTLCLSL